MSEQASTNCVRTLLRIANPYFLFYYLSEALQANVARPNVVEDCGSTCVEKPSDLVHHYHLLAFSLHIALEILAHARCFWMPALSRMP